MPKNKSKPQSNGNVQNYMQALEGMHYDFWHYRQMIKSERVSKEIRRYMQVIHNYKPHYYIPTQIKEELNKLKKHVRAMYTYDYTRDRLDADLKRMVNLLEEAILAENPSWEIPESYIRFK